MGRLLSFRREQQDPSEYLTFLLQEMNKNWKEKNGNNGTNPIESIFEGKLSFVQTCPVRTCGYRSETTDMYLGIILLPLCNLLDRKKKDRSKKKGRSKKTGRNKKTGRSNDDNSLTLNELIAEVEKEEKVEFKCEKCNQNCKDYKRKCTIFPGETVIFHIKRQASEK